ncbi:MAG: hypothetical protein K6G90_00270 [Clostridia bacterium]|nr:hypothetical protein [Clostridia bacterium]
MKKTTKKSGIYCNPSGRFYKISAGCAKTIFVTGAALLTISPQKTYALTADRKTRRQDMITCINCKAVEGSPVKAKQNKRLRRRSGQGSGISGQGSVDIIHYGCEPFL